MPAFRAKVQNFSTPVPPTHVVETVTVITHQNRRDGECRPCYCEITMRKGDVVCEGEIGRLPLREEAPCSDLDVDLGCGLAPGVSGICRLTFLSLGIGAIRCDRDPTREIGPRPRCLPPSLLQEHPRDRPGHQRLEASARRDLPRECAGAQGGRPHATIRWQHRTHCPRYDHPEPNGHEGVTSSLIVETCADGFNRQGLRCLQGPVARQVGRVPSRSPEERRGQR